MQFTEYVRCQKVLRHIVGWVLAVAGLMVLTGFFTKVLANSTNPDRLRVAVGVLTLWLGSGWLLGAIGNYVHLATRIVRGTGHLSIQIDKDDLAAVGRYMRESRLSDGFKITSPDVRLVSLAAGWHISWKIIDERLLNGLPIYVDIPIADVEYMAELPSQLSYSFTSQTLTVGESFLPLLGFLTTQNEIGPYWTMVDRPLHLDPLIERFRQTLSQLADKSGFNYRELVCRVGAVTLYGVMVKDDDADHYDDGWRIIQAAFGDSISWRVTYPEDWGSCGQDDQARARLLRRIGPIEGQFRPGKGVIYFGMTKKMIDRLPTDPAEVGTSKADLTMVRVPLSAPAEPAATELAMAS